MGKGAWETNGKTQAVMGAGQRTAASAGLDFASVRLSAQNRSEDIRTKLLARDFTKRSGLDIRAALGRYTALAVAPVPHCNFCQTKRLSELLTRRSTAVSAHPVAQSHGHKGYNMYPRIARPPEPAGLAGVDTLRIILWMSWRDEVRRLMRTKGIKQRDLMVPLGVTTRGAVGHYLSGRRDMSPEQFYALLKRLGVEAKDVFEPPDPDEPRPTHIAVAIESLPTDQQAAILKIVDCLSQSCPSGGNIESRKKSAA